MDQIGNTEPTTEESRTGHCTDEGHVGTKGGPTLAVYRAGTTDTSDDDGARASGTAGAAGPGTTDTGFPDGFSGTLVLQNLESFDDQAVGEVLVRVAHLIAWAEAQRARMLNRMETLFR
ncbi:hypothetical protein, partial [Arthrobacter sp. zg-Y750]|uniref:hypothetical protein n=1 Tax=Arthrobacter sp. zg-Y750 TaxID=2894189 RepID=UPI001E29EA94